MLLANSREIASSLLPACTYLLATGKNSTNYFLLVNPVSQYVRQHQLKCTLFSQRHHCFRSATNKCVARNRCFSIAVKKSPDQQDPSAGAVGGGKQE
jgi:hypothetical protein